MNAWSQPTKKQTLLLAFIAEFSREHGYSPSYREIMRAMDLKSVSAVAEHVENCVAAGYLVRVPKSARSLAVVEMKTYEETRELFRDKLASLRAVDPDDRRVGVLVEAARLLGLDMIE